MTAEEEIPPELSGDFGELIREVVAELPRQILEGQIDRKLAASGQTLPAEAKAALIQHILEGNEEDFTWLDESGEDVGASLTISFDDDDLAEIGAIQARLREQLPKEVLNQIHLAGAKTFKNSKSKWKTEGRLQADEAQGFKERLYQRWGKGIELLRMMLTMSRETGGEMLSRYHQASPAEVDIRFMLIVRLHARACQVVEEIICLLEGGLAEGAMGRWRTLHEISVVLTLIANGDQELATRFIEHETVDEWEELAESQLDAPMEPISEAEAQWRSDLKAHYDRLVDKYGKPFCGPYGWAAGLLSNKRPCFKDLQRHADKAAEQSHYKLASFNVHASARGTLYRLSRLGSMQQLMVGRSNAGLAEPGRNTAFTVAQITGALLGRPKTIDDMIAMKFIITARDQSARAFVRADRKLRREEAQLG